MNLDNVVDHYEMKNKYAREYHVAAESMSLLREELKDCVRTEGINQFVNCKDLREKYFALCMDRYKGMIFPEGKEPLDRSVLGLVKVQPK